MLGSHNGDVCCGYKGHVAVGMDGQCLGLAIQDWDMPTLAYPHTTDLIACGSVVAVAGGSVVVGLSWTYFGLVTLWCDGGKCFVK